MKPHKVVLNRPKAPSSAGNLPLLTEFVTGATSTSTQQTALPAGCEPIADSTRATAIHISTHSRAGYLGILFWCPARDPECTKQVSLRVGDGHASSHEE